MAVRHRFLALPSQRAQRWPPGHAPVPFIVFGVTYGLREYDGETVEVCDECGFDAREVQDVASSLRASYAELDSLRSSHFADQRPDVDTWSGVEYAEHVLDGTNTVLHEVSVALARPTPENCPDLASASAAAVALYTGLNPSEQRLPCPFMGAPTSVAGLIVHLLHDAEHHVLDVRRGLASRALASFPDVITVNR